MTTQKELRILHLEDMPSDAELVERHLREAGLPFLAQHAATRDAFARALEEFHPDVVLSDYSIPHFDGLSAIRLVRQKDPDLPIVVVTGVLGDEAAAGVIKAGANDYILKDRLARLASAVERAVLEAEQSRSRKRAEDLVREQNRVLEEQNRMIRAASRAKNQFVANMSHELRSPLNGIIGFSELLYDGKLGPLAERPREFVGRIHTSATHLLRLINDVLDLSKMEAGHMEFRPERVIVSDVIREVIGILAALAAEEKIGIQTEIEALADEVYTDPERLKQVFYNYLSNALKFTGAGGRIVVRLKAEGATEFRLEVTDTGIGIQEKDLGRLFVEFQQLDATAAKRHPGTGLGLALTRRIVEAQGGRVGVESVYGQGSTFFAVLPRTPLRDRSSGAIAKVLVIDDDKAGRFLVTRILESAGCRVETAATCAEAVEKCQHTRFDAITLDLLLKDGPGWDALHKIRSLSTHRETPVIVVSGLEKNDKPLEDRVQGFLSKPVGANELLKAMNRVGVPIRPMKAVR